MKRRNKFYDYEETLQALESFKISEIFQYLYPAAKLSKANARGEVVCRCPFHNDKNPSFSMNDKLGLYQCWGCKERGNKISLIVKGTGSHSWYEAIEEFEAITGFRFPTSHESSYKGKNLDKVLENEQKRQVANESLRYLADYYKNGAPVGIYNYLQDTRRISPTTAQRFQLGYAWYNSNLWLHFIETKNRNASRILEELGYIKSNQQGKPYDAFRDRLMFPIRDELGDVVAFAGRDLSEYRTGNPKDTAKYVNSSESFLYKKRQHLYGWFEALEEKRKRDGEGKAELIVVEGYFDVLRLYECGYPQVVATCSATLTNEQALKVFHKFNNVYLCLDGDPAGVEGTSLSIINALPYLKGHQTLKVISLIDSNNPQKKNDPDSFLLEYGVPTFQHLKLNALNWFEWLTMHLIHVTKEQNPSPSMVIISVLNQFKAILSKEVRNRKIDSDHTLRLCSHLSHVFNIELKDVMKRLGV